LLIEFITRPGKRLRRTGSTLQLRGGSRDSAEGRREGEHLTLLLLLKLLLLYHEAELHANSDLQEYPAQAHLHNYYSV